MDCKMEILSPSHINEIPAYPGIPFYTLDVGHEGDWEVWAGGEIPTRFRGPIISVPLMITSLEEVENRKKEYSYGVHLPNNNGRSNYVAGFYREIH